MRLRLGLLVALALALALPAAGAGGGPAFTKTDGIAIRADDGVKLAATLYEPTGRRPAAGWPAIVMFHGLGGTRRDMDPLAAKAFAPAGYAVLAFDARGQGQSGGLFDADGPRTQRDTREVFDWLAARPEIDRARVGAWGISLGGGAVLHALVDGVPFAAAVVNETWSDLYSALVPQDLAKSGVVLGLLSTVPVARTDPSVLAVKLPGLTSTSLAAAADVRRRPLDAAAARLGEDAGRLVPGAPRLRLRHLAGRRRLPGARRPEAAVRRRLRPPPVDLARAGRRGRLRRRRSPGFAATSTDAATASSGATRWRSRPIRSAPEGTRPIRRYPRPAP